MKKTLIIVPTYDEIDNVGPISKTVLGLLPEAHLLFVDDNSPDGTGDLLDKMHADDERINVLHKPEKAGLGRAYIAGFKWALERDYEFIFEMDADFSHDPNELPNFLKAAEEADLVLGSRYVDGIRITNWPMRRLLLSKSAATYVRVLTGMPVSDPTGGFKCYRRAVLKEIELDAIESNGYSFQVEMTHNAWNLGFRIKEIPITFVDRRAGYSKMSTVIFKEALWMVWKLAFKNGFRRKPQKARGAGGAGVSESPRPFSKMREFIVAMRPNQWTKNGVVLAAFFFAFWDRYHAGEVSTPELVKAVPAFLLFCLASSAVYLMNDIRDADADRHHPLKKHRPIASGKIGRGEAAFVALLILIAALAGAWFLSLYYMYTMLAYVGVQLLYTFILKKVALVDVMVIAGGFVLRAIAGAVVISGANASPWLLICTFLLALFLGLCKRRHEKLFVDKEDTTQRPSLQGYDGKLLDQLIAITSGATIVSYAIYTFWPETVLKFGTHALGFTVPFVIFGIFRYLDLVYRHDKGDRPEKILLTDIPLLASVALYGLSVLAILVFM